MSSPIPFRPTKTQKKAIDEYMQENQITQSDAIRKLVDQALNMENRFAFLDDNPCALRDFLGEDEAHEGKKEGEGWYCMKKAPALTRLGSGITSAAQKICGKCKIRDGALADSKLLNEQRTKGIQQRIPHCAQGAKLSEDMTKFICPKLGGWRLIMDRKKTKDYKPCRLEGIQNAQCKSLSFSTVFIKGDTPDLEKAR